jgi:hypothetical protein
VTEPSAQPSEGANPPPARPPDRASVPDDPADHALSVLRHGPPLLLVAVLAAVIEMVLARVLWHGLPDVLEPSDLFEMRRWARFPRNLAAVSGILGLSIALFGFLRFPGYAPIAHRLGVAAFSGIFMPSIIVAALLRPEMLRRKLVIFALAAANVLVTLLVLSGVRYRADRALRIAVGLAGATSLLTLFFVAIGQLTAPDTVLWDGLAAFLAARTSGMGSLALWVRHAGELSWIGVLALGCFTAVYDRGGPGLPVRAITALVLTVAFTVAVLALEDLVGHRFRLALIGSFRFGLVIDDEPKVYAFPLAVGLAGACVAIARRDPALRQLGGALLLWIAGGFAPHSPIQLLYFVLASVLLTRAAQARDPAGAWRSRQPWARFTGIRVKPSTHVSETDDVAISRRPSPRPEG